MISGARQWLKTACEAFGSYEPLEAHHVDENYKNNVPENIQTLCRPCHRAEHLRKHEFLYFIQTHNVRARLS
jgi:HNH endonuclease